MGREIHKKIIIGVDEIMNVKSEIKILLENPVLIYGAGKASFRLILNLKALNANIIGLAVSDISDKKIMSFDEYFDGYKVRQAKEYEAYKDSAVVLIATSGKFHDEIKSNCLRLGFKKIVLYTPELIKELSLITHKNLFAKNNLPLDTEIISLGNGKYLNPFSDLFPQKFGILDQWEDICSTVLGDTSMSFEGAYEYDKVKISSGDIVLDIGAAIGNVSVYAASKGAIVYAFEPSPENYPFIKRHSELNAQKIHLEPYAVSNECGMVKFFVNSDCDTASALAGFTNEKSCEEIAVAQITVDEFVKENKLAKVDYIHCNIMGAEHLMLQGAQETLRTFAPKLAICAYYNNRKILSDLILKANPRYNIIHKWGKIYAYV